MVLTYQKHAINVKIDISRNIRKANTYELRNFFGTDITTQDIATIVANKLVALTERKAQRDIFDAYFFLSQ